MMKINILTLFPNMFDGFVNESIIKRAISDNKVKIDINNIRDYANNKHNQVDDTPYGGGAGMVLMCEPVFKAVEDLKKKGTKVIMMTPQGKVFNQEKAVKLSKEKHLLIICGHYEGFDERITSIVDEEISIGDYILTGGEIPAMAVTDSVVRLIPGVIDDDSKANESFTDGLLDYPTYTKPREYRGMKVPNVLLSGDHKKIDEWRKEKQIEKTLEKRPEIIKNNIRKQIGDYSIIDDLSNKKMVSINLDNPYKFNPSKKKEKCGIKEVLLVEPKFTNKIAKKNIQKKIEELIRQAGLVINDETDDEGSSYVLGEIERMQSLILSTYASYLDNEYLTLVIFKLEALKSEINMKQMEKLQTVNYEKKGRSR